jgi:hypothetical protein
MFVGVITSMDSNTETFYQLDGFILIKKKKLLLKVKVKIHTSAKISSLSHQKKKTTIKLRK